MEIKIEKSFRKTLSMRVRDDGEIIVKAPISCSNDYIFAFVNKNKEKLISRVKKVNNSLKTFVDNGVFLLFGEKSSIKLSNKKEFIKISKNYLEERTKYLAILHNFNYNNLIVKNFTARWGSCDKNKNISLNYKLVMLNKSIIDYVILHELCHLTHLNHSKNFYNLLNKCLPNHKLLKNELNKVGYLCKV